jgi:hypothetical protein
MNDPMGKNSDAVGGETAPDVTVADPVLDALDQASAAIDSARQAYQGEEAAEPASEEAGAGPAKQGKGSMMGALGL